MKKATLLYALLAIIPFYAINAQVSHGGSPLPFIKTKSTPVELFKDMPSFDVEKEIKLAEQNDSDLKGGYQFAYKFITDLNESNSGITSYLPDGTRIWRLGIRSKGALSINLLFSEFELPEGAQVFLYNPDQTHVLGSFTYLNNSEKKILPVSPVQGDELIIEYHEPASASFPGRLKVGEVNHAYRSLKGYEPGGDRAEYFCMPSPVCFDDEYATVERSVVLITINGVTACTGVMLNNTSNDGKPYILTASHCLNKNFSVKNPDYEEVAGTVVCFFNYSSPTCDPVMRGTEEMSVASSFYRAVNEKNDMSLLELHEAPPVYYRPYYAGWDISGNGSNPPYTGIHHPRASVKRVNIANDKITLKSFDIGQIDFYKNAHWNVSKWSTGSTASGSSGSPLFDSKNRVIGGLSGGSSSCYTPVDDYYFSLSKAWEPVENKNQQLKYWLDPVNSNKHTIEGFDPFESNPCHRLSNVLENNLQDNIEVTPFTGTTTGNMFGINSLKTIEYAEEYKINGNARIYGVYLVTPPITDNAGQTDVDVIIYDGNGEPQSSLRSVKFKPKYTELSIIDSSFTETEKWLNRSQESFIHFEQPVDVSGTFYIGYKINSPANSTFAVYNLSKGKTSRNTAWIKSNDKWTKASAHPVLPFNTSLYIDPVIQYTNGVSNETGVEQPIKPIISAVRKSIHILLLEGIENADLLVYSVNGRLIHQTVVTSEDKIYLPDIKTGIYIVNVKSDKLNYSEKIFFH